MVGNIRYVYKCSANVLCSYRRAFVLQTLRNTNSFSVEELGNEIAGYNIIEQYIRMQFNPETITGMDALSMRKYVL